MLLSLVKADMSAIGMAPMLMKYDIEMEGFLPYLIFLPSYALWALGSEKTQLVDQLGRKVSKDFDFVIASHC